MGSIISSSIQYLKGIGPKRAKLFEKFGIRTTEDVMYHFPRLYEDRSKITPISELAIGQRATVKVEVLSKKARPAYGRRLTLFEITAGDETGRIFAVWFNQAYLKNSFNIGDQVILCGKAELYKNRIQMSSPEFEIADLSDDSLSANRIVPTYSLPDGISQKVFRKTVKTVLDKELSSLVDAIPFDIRQRHKLLNIARSLRNIHFPEDESMRLEAYKRLCFDEFFMHQIPLMLRRLKRRTKKGIAFTIDQGLLDRFIASLSFSLTASQKGVLEDIQTDMRSSRPMQRLLEGDVGCGKTVVATIAALAAIGGGFQAAMMVPTEILANQHYEKITSQFSALRPVLKIKMGLLTSRLALRERTRLAQRVQNGDVHLLVGTHALLQESVKFRNLGLIIIDEQHRFGVSQRALLARKAVNADILIMTATPIPRTLSMTLYGDLDISCIKEQPEGRKKIISRYYRFDQRDEAYNFVKGQMRQGRQGYVIYPLIEESLQLELNSAIKMHRELSETVFKEFKVGLIHGRLPQRQQEAVMRAFRGHDLDLLVATTVLEVGIDVPNASVVLIEHAERFGLSQLHQIRGRIGRGQEESYCCLLADPRSEEAQLRIRSILEHSDGFRIAEEDLKLRGPGEFFGERQHGLTQLKIANPLKQMHILRSAQQESLRLLNDDARLQKRQNQELKKRLYQRFPGFEKFMMVG